MRRRFQKITRWKYLIDPLSDLLIAFIAYGLFLVGYIYECKKGNAPAASMLAGGILLLFFKLQQIKKQKDRE